MIYTMRAARKRAARGYAFIKNEGQHHHLSVLQLHANIQKLCTDSLYTCPLGLALDFPHGPDTPYHAAMSIIGDHYGWDSGSDGADWFSDNYGFDIEPAHNYAPFTTSMRNWFENRAFALLSRAWLEVVAKNPADGQPQEVPSFLPAGL